MSFAQYGVDDFILSLFPANHKGNYVDVGAAHPYIDNNTFLFYRTGLWTGICIDPIAKNIEAHRLYRANDLQILACIGDYDGETTFYQCTENTVSTSIKDEADKRRESGQTVVPYRSVIFKLDTLLMNYDHSEIDLLSIDVEGAEREVLLGYTNLNAKVIVIESCLPCTDIPSYEDWEFLLTQKGYKYLATYGVNRVYKKES